MGGLFYLLGKMEIIQILVDLGADIDAKVNEGLIPLQVAASKGNFEYLCLERK